MKPGCSPHSANLREHRPTDRPLCVISGTSEYRRDIHAADMDCKWSTIVAGCHFVSKTIRSAQLAGRQDSAEGRSQSDLSSLRGQRPPARPPRGSPKVLPRTVSLSRHRQTHATAPTDASCVKSIAIEWSTQSYRSRVPDKCFIAARPRSAWISRNDRSHQATTS